MESFSQQSKENQTPFKKDLVESEISQIHEGSGYLNEFENDPSKIIRIMSFDAIRENYQNQVDPITLAGLGKKLYEELETNYGIPVPVEYIAGKDKQGKKAIYGITDRIRGNKLNEVEVTAELAEKIEELYTSLSIYYLDKSKRLSDGKMYLTDINNASQYVYGGRTKSEQPRIYMVDTDLHLRNDKVSFYYVVAWLIRHMASAERRCGKKFDIARENIVEILNNPVMEGLSEEEIKDINNAISEAKNFLEGRFTKNSDNLPTGV